MVKKTKIGDIVTRFWYTLKSLHPLTLNIYINVYKIIKVQIHLEEQVKVM
jgi:hypothetical protein